jgi:hypothetical protein
LPASTPTRTPKPDANGNGRIRYPEALEHVPLSVYQLTYFHHLRV